VLCDDRLDKHFAYNNNVSFALSRANASGVSVAPTPTTSDEIQDKVDKIWDDEKKKTDEWVDSAQKTVVSITSNDGLDLVGDVFMTDPNSHKWLIAIHGYTGKRENLPVNVKAIIDDCGYTSVWDEFTDEAKYLFHIPQFPILHTASVISQMRAGYNFKEASALEQVKKTKIPILFIHGAKDNFVNTDMVYSLYDVCPTQKDIYVVEGAGHGQAFYVDPVSYFGKVFGFIDSIE